LVDTGSVLNFEFVYDLNLKALPGADCPVR